MTGLVRSFHEGGFFMYPISVLFITATIIIVERFYMILFVYSADGAALMQKIQRLVLENNIDEALRICNSKKNAAIYQVFKAALVVADRPVEDIQDHVEVANMSVVPRLQRRMPYLFTIANVATLIGLLGTIHGLITTFQAVGDVSDSEKQALISAGISTALNATAFGLMVAIPCSLAYGFLFNRINWIIDDMEHFSGRLLILLRTGSQYFEHFHGDDGEGGSTGPALAGSAPNATVSGANAGSANNPGTSTEPPPEGKRRKGKDAA